MLSTLFLVGLSLPESRPKMTDYLCLGCSSLDKRRLINVTDPVPQRWRYLSLRGGIARVQQPVSRNRLQGR
jgi:hypothetical protein